SALAVNTRGTEGTDIPVTIPQVSSAKLGIAAIDVTQPTTVDPFNVPQGFDSNTISAKDAEVRVSTAIETVVAARDQIGAQVVGIQQSINDTSLQAVKQQASESTIRDADIGKEAANNARNTILDQIATSTIVSVQASEKTMATSLAAIISNGPKGH
ncbi:MAG: hypothetical protein M3N19_11595, partial [Candidatus Eremiobacteraeota bacterium]|nr:hypothetical protein [Candidatus Eremiobacteraeota bacterium]